VLHDPGSRAADITRQPSVALGHSWLGLGRPVTEVGSTADVLALFPERLVRQARAPLRGCRRICADLRKHRRGISKR
jgi:hypothetical protein